jgi:hypothetical protein
VECEGLPSLWIAQACLRSEIYEHTSPSGAMLVFFNLSRPIGSYNDEEYEITKARGFLCWPE